MLAQGLGRLLGVVHILLHDGGAGQQDLALFTIGQLLVGAWLDDLDIGIGEGKADGALLVDVGGCQAAGGNGFGGAVALPYLHDSLVVIQEFVELLLQLDGQAVAAGEYALETAEVGAVHAGQTQQSFVQRRYAGDEVALVLDDLLGVALGGEPGDQNAAPALGQHGVDAHAQSEAVEQGHGGQHPVAGPEHGVGGDDLLAEGVEVAVGQHDALGGAGGAAGVEDHRRIVKTTLHPVVLIEAEPGHVHELLPADHRRVIGDLLDLAPLSQHIAGPDGAGQGVLHRGDDDVDDAGVLADMLELVIELVQRDGGGGLGFVEIEFDLLFRRQGMDHVGDGAHQIDGIEHVNGLGAVGHGDGDLVAGAHAQSLQALGAALDLLHHLSVCSGFAHEIEGNIVGILLGDAGHCFKHTALKIVQMHGHIAHIVFPRGFDFTHSALPPSKAFPILPGAPAGTSAAAPTWSSSSRLPAARRWSGPDPASLS